MTNPNPRCAQPLRKLTAQDILIATAWHHRRVTWAEIARHLNVNPDTVRRCLDPEFREHRRAMIAAAKARRAVVTPWPPL